MLAARIRLSVTRSGNPAISIEGTMARREHQHGDPLSRCEKQIERLMVLGRNSKEVANSLGISHRTVEDHRLAVLTKRGVSNVVMLIRLMYGLDEVDEQAKIRRDAA